MVGGWIRVMENKIQEVRMAHEYIRVQNAGPLSGELTLEGAKNAVLVTMASLVLTRGKSRLTRVPASHDVYQMKTLLEELGAEVLFDEQKHELIVDTTFLNGWSVSPDLMKRMRASILVMGPLLARFGKAKIALPGGCLIGTRPVDLHLKAFARMGATITTSGDFLQADVEKIRPCRFVMDYPSVGATENILMAAAGISGVTEIVNAALEPEVLDLITVLRNMGAHIDFAFPATIVVQGSLDLKPVEHEIMCDRLEAGTLLIAVAATGGTLSLPDAPVDSLELVLEKLSEMGLSIEVGPQGRGVKLTSHRPMNPVSFKTMPYPGFPTDLQAPMTALLSLASGKGVIHETVFENRLLHVPELQKMGAQISLSGDRATITGVERLYGASVIATDIRAAAALVIAGLAAEGETRITGIHHLLRGYEGLDQKLRTLGACIEIVRD
ncbi:MAG: UDP-N-acetylglucosamine enolpyruvyl transferase [candidate division TM6 bacterium GW2011_GWF2_43_87]|nr:MAG: UDP-N-acetylglucosamine enolpyruvyl transferase [candidate division TM6 bacterium GW2011_GWF2_43_87]